MLFHFMVAAVICIPIVQAQAQDVGTLAAYWMADAQVINENCPSLEFDLPKAKRVLKSYGLNLKEIERPWRQQQKKEFVEDLKTSGTKVCQLLWEAYGKDGRGRHELIRMK